MECSAHGSRFVVTVMAIQSAETPAQCLSADLTVGSSGVGAHDGTAVVRTNFFPRIRAKREKKYGHFADVWYTRENFSSMFLHTLLKISLPHLARIHQLPVLKVELHA